MMTRKVNYAMIFILLFAMNPSLGYSGYGDSSERGISKGDFNDNAEMIGNRFGTKPGIQGSRFVENAQVFSMQENDQGPGMFGGEKASHGKLFKRQLREENKKYLKKRIDEVCDTISDREKDRLITVFIAYSHDRGSFEDIENDAHVDFLIGLARDETKAFDEKEKEIETHFKGAQDDKAPGAL